MGSLENFREMFSRMLENLWAVWEIFFYPISLGRLKMLKKSCPKFSLWKNPDAGKNFRQFWKSNSAQ
jgi:hypothetical protein